jgi:hypothetical protein
MPEDCSGKKWLLEHESPTAQKVYSNIDAMIEKTS